MANRNNISRVTVVERIYHQNGIGPIYTIDTATSFQLTSNEQVYYRNLLVEEEWIPLDLGWIEKPFFIVIQNLEGKGLRTYPTDEEKVQIEAKVIELSLAEPHTHPVLIPPGDSLKIKLQDPKSARIRCQKGNAIYTITAIPQ